MIYVIFINKSTADSGTNTEALHDDPAAAKMHAKDPDAQQHPSRATALVEDLQPTPLVEFPVCERVDLREQIEEHDCSSGHVR